MTEAGTQSPQTAPPDEPRPAADPTLPLVAAVQGSRLHLARGDSAAALAAAREALAREPGDRELRRDAIAAALDLGDLAEARHHYDVAAALEPNNSKWTVERIQLEIRHDMPAAIALLRAEFDRPRPRPEVLKLGPRLSLPGDVRAQLVEYAERLLHAATEPEQRAGRLIMAMSDGTGERPDPDRKRKVHRKQLNALVRADIPADDSLRRPLVVDDGSEVVIARCDRPRRVVFVFCGFNHLAFGRLGLFDSYLAALDLTAVYLRDRTNSLLFNAGIASIASDFEGTVARLEDLVEELGGRDGSLATVGMSSGGFGALRYGLALRAGMTINFSSPTNISADFMSGDGRLLAAATWHNNRVPREAQDLREAVIAAGGKTAIHLLFGQYQHLDARQARHLEGLPNVTLHPVPGGDTHNVLSTLAARHEVLPTLRTLLGISSSRDF